MATVLQVEENYQAAIEKLHQLANSNTATSEQRDAARDALNDLLLAHATNVIQTIEGRTAMLTALIAELEGVIRQVQSNPIGSALDALNGIVSKARTLYEEAKNDLRQT